MGHADGCVRDEASRDQELKALVRVPETKKRRRKEEAWLVKGSLSLCYKTAEMQF